MMECNYAVPGAKAKMVLPASIERVSQAQRQNGVLLKWRLKQAGSRLLPRGSAALWPSVSICLNVLALSTCLSLSRAIQARLDTRTSPLEISAHQHAIYHFSCLSAQLRLFRVLTWVPFDCSFVWQFRGGGYWPVDGLGG